MKMFVCAAIVFLSLAPTRAMAQDDCIFDRAGVARQLSAKAKKVVGAKRVSPTEYRWVEPSGRIATIGYGGCVDLGAKVSVSRPVRVGAPLGEHDLIQAVAKYWSAIDAKSLAEALAGSRGEERVEGNVRVADFGPGAGGTFSLGFTVSLSPDHVEVSWQDL